MSSQMARSQRQAFELDFGGNPSESVVEIVDDLGALLEFSKDPARHWIHLKDDLPEAARPSSRPDCEPKSPQGSGYRGSLL